MKKVIFLILALPVLSGCHTINPSLLAEAQYTNLVSQNPAKVLLVMDEAYTGYVSKDRGSALADPQTYKVGQALEPLTLDFFQEGFSDVQVLKMMPDSASLGDSQYVIKPSVQNFDNRISMSSQSITVTLKAEIYDRQLGSIGSVSSEGFHEGSMGILGSSKKSGFTVSKALQSGLSNLVNQVQAKI